jgi:ketol-acid reductoisomerase
MKPGATLGLSHGFLLGVMKNDGVDFRKDINVVLVAPKVRAGTLDFRGLLKNQKRKYLNMICDVGRQDWPGRSRSKVLAWALPSSSSVGGHGCC